MFRKIIVTIILLCPLAVITAQQHAYKVIDSLFSDYAAKNNCPGTVYAIVGPEGTMHSGKIGYGNLEKRYAADEHTAFRIASMTKSTVAMAILQLRDAGKLSLDDPAAKYIRELDSIKYPTADSPPLTVRNLLTHAAGFPEDNPWGDRQLGISDEKMLDMFRKGISFSNAPGIAYEYSNMGFAMLGYIIKKVSGQRYEDYITQNIFRPLGMDHSYWEYSDVPEKTLALGYRYLNGQHVKQPMLHDGAYGAMGGLITTLEDFQRYVSFHLSAWPPRNEPEHGPLRRSSLREMQKAWQFSGLYSGSACPLVTAYGYGLRWSTNCHGTVSVGHSGGLPGFGSNWTILPDYGIGMICFSNSTYAPASRINMKALDTLITMANLQPYTIRVSKILEQRKDELVRLLPEWQNAPSTPIFAENFFLDYFPDSLRKESLAAFKKAGRIVRVHDIVPENNLRGTFVIEGQNANVEVYFTLSPESPPLIQEFNIRSVPSQPKTDAVLQKILSTNEDPLFRKVIGDPDKYRLQIIYTKIDRDRNNVPSFTNYYFHHDPNLYFYPASVVKMPLAFLSLEKINRLNRKGVTKNATVIFDSSESWHRPLRTDTTAADGRPTIAHFIKRAFLISENDPYNRMYQWLGQGPINRSLHEKGYGDVRITRQFMGITEEQNRLTNGLHFVDAKGRTIYTQPPLHNTDSFDFSHVIKLGRGHLDQNDSLVMRPLDFTKQNSLSLLSMQQMLQSVLFPESVAETSRFLLKPDDYKFLYRYLSQYPSETPDPKYDTAEFYDSYVKFFFRNSTRRMPGGVRVFNKVGWSYGFLTDVSYVADFNNKVEFMLSATLYVNNDGILNDNAYEYDSVGHPFLYQLGQTLYQHELKRRRQNPPDLSRFTVKYEKRDPNDKRLPLSEVDN